MLIFIAYMQPLDPQLFEPNTDRKALLLFIQGLFLLVWLIPAAPMCIGGLALLGMCPISRLLAVFLAISSVVIGLLLTLASGVLALFSDTQLLHGISLTIAIASSFLIWSGRDGKPNPSRTAKIGISISTLIALWSLLTIPMLLFQARLIADGSPYCIAEHSENSPIEALHELRGFSFYTTKTGYKSTSEWYFHGLMIVDHPDDQRVYNWSPRHRRFDLVERPDALIEPVRNVCVAK
ncbi:hypothetical protein [Ruegeria sp. AU67]|uniref:hypothetical protein n=1 Tax=Ruegeria sp. AU67 TaxID=2108530 RepID=UPI000D698328|nr:hypothetical protein [Ruegeria sp. AU67]